MRILKKVKLEDFLFIDIETVPIEESLQEDSPLWDAWEYYCKNKDIDDIAALYDKEASFHAEFARIACITIGVIHEGKIHVKTFNDLDEKKLLQEFVDTLKDTTNLKTQLCGHAIINFDAPFIMKRLIVNGVDLPVMFDVAHLKPWEVNYLDTANLWKGTAYKASSLIAVATALGLPSPKEDISGGNVRKLYFEGDIDRISRYCERDVIATANVVMKLRGEEPLEAEVGEIETEPLGLLEYLYLGGEYNDDVKEQLWSMLAKMNQTDRERAFVILYSIPSKAKGKETHITKKDVKDLENGKF